MTVYITLSDTNTLARITGTVELIGAGFWQQQPTTPTTPASFNPTVPGDYSIISNAPTYTGKTTTVRLTEDVLRIGETVDIYLTPPPPPIPAPGDEIVVGKVGCCCEIVNKAMFGRDWYAYRNIYTNAHSNWDSERADAEYSASSDNRCFTPPEVPPQPGAPGNIIEAIGQQNTQQTNTLTDALQGVKNTIQNDIGSVMAGVGSLSSVLESVWYRLEFLPRIDAWQRKFKFPDWDTVVVQPINSLLQPIRDVLAWTKTFQFPDFNTVVVQPINNLLQPMRDMKAALDSFLTFAWFTRLVTLITDAIDVWFSRKFGIDPTRPFWDEFEKKIMTLSTKILMTALDAVFAEFPEKKQEGK